MTCKEDDCSGAVAARGWCRKHYMRWRTYGHAGPTPKQLAAPKQITCAATQCGKVFTAHGSADRKYCSAECFHSSYVARTIRPKICGHCGEEYQPIGRSQKYCPACLGPATVDARGVTRYAGGWRLFLYGVSHPDWLRMLSRHNGMCWICKEREATDLDHRHSDGKVRGALCGRCNTRLHVLENEHWLTAAQEYLDATDAEG